MDKVKVDGSIFSVSYRTNSEMRTKATFKGGLYKQGLSCDVYNVENGLQVALILTSVRGDILKSTTIISIEEYEAIAALYDPFAAGRYHTALLERCGAENHFGLL